MTTTVVAVSAHADVVSSDSRAPARGGIVYRKYCVLCHGAQGAGDGHAAALQQVRPADLTASSRNAAYKRDIVTRGGAALGRSSSMPRWGEVLSQQQIADVVEYLAVLAAAGGDTPPAPVPTGRAPGHGR